MAAGFLFYMGEGVFVAIEAKVRYLHSYTNECAQSNFEHVYMCFVYEYPYIDIVS